MLGLIDLPFLLILFLPIATVLLGIKLYIANPWAVCKDSKNLTGKTVIITGANTGIGKETALDLAKRGARVILACRDLKKAAVARDEIVDKSGNRNVVVRQLNLASLQSVRKFAADILKSETRLDILINNAGCMVTEKKMTEDGLEYQMQSNHFGHFLLTNLLLGLLVETEASRVINVSALAHVFVKDLDMSNLNFTRPGTGEKFFEIYSATKLCNVLFTRELAKRLSDAGKNVTVNALHPGIIHTEFIRIPWLRTISEYTVAHLLKSPWQGAQTTIHLAVSDELIGVTGKYFSDCKPVSVSALARNDELAAELWMKSEEFVQLKPEERFF